MKLFAGVLTLLLALAAAAGALFLLPYGPRAERFVAIAPGTPARQIAAQLEHAGIVRSQYAIDVLSKVKGGTLRAGEYRFDHPATPAEVYARLRRGDVFTLALVIPEGFNIFDIASAVEAAGLGNRASFLAAERSHTDLLHGLLPSAAPRPSSLEGFLFPDTYRFSRHATPEQMLGTMVHRFRAEAAKLGLHQDTLFRTVIVASLVEREVRQPAERPLVAGVFQNRLERGMPLQTDPSVIYAALLENRYRGTIYASDLRSDAAYNTYRHTGLPPGPICSPGADSLRAAMHPAKTDYLYFVADAAGHSRFSTGLEEHARQVEAFRAAGRQP